MTLYLSLDDNKGALVMKHNNGLDDLLFLDGTVLVQEFNFWVKIEAKRTKFFNIGRANNIKYSLTLHNTKGERILGYDNSHKTVSGQKQFDHVHEFKTNKVKPYQFVSAEKLLVDFWLDVDKALTIISQERK